MGARVPRGPATGKIRPGELLANVGGVVAGCGVALVGQDPHLHDAKELAAGESVGVDLGMPNAVTCVDIAESAAFNDGLAPELGGTSGIAVRDSPSTTQVKISMLSC